MRIPLGPISASGMALTAWCGVVSAQTSPPPLSSATPAAMYDPRQFPAIGGELERLTLNARGDIDGFILKDGTEVKTAPNLSTQIAFALKPGDRLNVHGLKAAALPLVRAMSVTDEVTHRTVTDSGVSANQPPPSVPLPPRGAAPPTQGASAETSGRVRMALHGPQGEVNGVLLDSGVILRFSPERTDQLASLIQPRHSLVAQGITVTNSLGTVVDVQQLGPSRDRLVAVGPPPPMGDRDFRGPRRGPPPPGSPQGVFPSPPAGPIPAPGALPPLAPPAG